MVYEFFTDLALKFCCNYLVLSGDLLYGKLTERCVQRFILGVAPFKARFENLLSDCVHESLCLFML